ncbi:MAG: ABC transporter permease, partial [Dehalococcoidia bacterium]|nr:ABC transporter permease [Dehalococcoidia bacterium]
MRSPTRGARTALRLVSYASILALWIVGARLLGSNVLPGPGETFAFILREADRGVLLPHLWITAQRVLAAFVVGMLLGTVLGAAMGLSRRADDLLQGWLVVTLT